MQAKATRILPLLTGLLLVSACNECDPEIAPTRPRLVVDPTEVDIASAPVAQDTPIIITISNPSNAHLYFDDIYLDESNGDVVRFEIVEQPAEVFASTSAEVRVVVRPAVVGPLEALLVIDAEDDAFPNHAEVPIRVNGVDLGLPDIEVEPGEVDFERIGEGDVARATVTIRNTGVRDLIIDETAFTPDDVGDASIRLTTPVQPRWAIAPMEEISVDLVFAPTDINPHEGVLTITSNDPDEPLVEVPVRGQGTLCPVAVAELVDELEGIEPLDTIRITGENSYAQSLGTDIETFEWRLVQRPVGSTAILDLVSDERIQLTCDLAGDYEVALTVVDTDGVRSCEDEIVRVHVEPSEDLHVQLVWDHPTADLDLHTLKSGGQIFTHEGDVYFSNREPLEWFPENPDWVPSLDADDNRGYGPENTNVKHPEPGSTWRVCAHYWNKQTDGDAFTIATLRIYAYGQLVAEIPQSFDTDQMLWCAADIVWSDTEGEMPQINQLGLIEPFPRPF